MIRKQTVILLIVFAALVAVLLYLQKNPLPARASLTPSPTTRAQVIPDVMQGDITMLVLKVKGAPGEILVKQNGDKWLLGSDGKEVTDTGKVEQLRAEIAALRVVTEMPEETADSALGLTEPAYVLTVQTDKNVSYQLQIGDKTPIENGYYAKVDEGFAFVVSNTAIDTIVSLMQELGTPALTPTP